MPGGCVVQNLSLDTISGKNISSEYVPGGHFSKQPHSNSQQTSFLNAWNKTFFTGIEQLGLSTLSANLKFHLSWNTIYKELNEFTLSKMVYTPAWVYCVPM